MTFTKEEAKALFDNRRIQRHVRNAGVRQYTDLMNNKKWREYDRAQAPILIDTKGKLAGGQHRFAAFIASDLDTITFPVALDASEDEIRNQDAAINRTFNDLIAMFHSVPKFDNITPAKLTAVGRILANAGGSPAEVARALTQAKTALKAISALIDDNGVVQGSAPIIAGFVFAHKHMTQQLWSDTLTDFDGSTNAKNSPMALLAKSLDTRRQNLLYLSALCALRATHTGDKIAELTPTKAMLEGW